MGDLSTNTILLAGFEPFGGWNVNSSAQVVERLAGQMVGGARIHGLVMPVEFGEDIARILPAIEALRPRLVLCLGLSAGATGIDVEHFAVNLRYGHKEPAPLARIEPRGPAACFSTLPVDRAAAAIREVGVPARAHCFAGVYLCNHVFYCCLRSLSRIRPAPACGFLHLPMSTEGLLGQPELSGPTLPLETLVRGVAAAIEAGLAVGTKRVRSRRPPAGV